VRDGFTVRDDTPPPPEVRLSPEDAKPVERAEQQASG